MADEDSLFMRLPCGHEFAVESMDAHVDSSLERNPLYIQCPLCTTRLTHSYRYQSVKYKGLTAEMHANVQAFKSSQKKDHENLFQQAVENIKKITNLKKKFEGNRCAFVESLGVYLTATKPIDDAYQTSNGQLPKNIAPSLCQRAILASLHLQHVNVFAGSYVMQINLSDSLNALSKLPSFYCVENVRKNVQAKLLTVLDVKVDMGKALSAGPAGDDYLDGLMKEYRELHRDEPLSQEERQQIHAALAAAGQIQPRGAWNRCPCGYIYAIGDCGGATVTAQCPECKQTIGGTQHRNLNQHTGLMDGSAAHAWPQ